MRCAVMKFQYDIVTVGCVSLTCCKLCAAENLQKITKKKNHTLGYRSMESKVSSQENTLNRSKSVFKMNTSSISNTCTCYYIFYLFLLRQAKQNEFARLFFQVGYKISGFVLHDFRCVRLPIITLVFRGLLLCRGNSIFYFYFLFFWSFITVSRTLA